MYSKKKTTIIVMMVAVFVMVVGYAAFSANLIISGTANVASNWNVYISNIETKTVYGKAENASGSPTYSNLSARMEVNLKQPGDYITYELTITNGGSLDATIENIKATNFGSSAIIHTINGISKGEPIANGATKKFSVTIEYDPTVTNQPETLDNTLILDINCVQDLNQNIPGGDIDINAPEIITLSGNNNLTLNSAFPTNLANYKITGNSVQSKLPSEYQQVEYIESTGEQYIDTQWYDKALTKIELDFIYTGTKYNSSTIYYMGTNSGNLLLINENGYMNIAGSSSTSITATVGERYNVSLYRDENSKRSGVINGVSMTGTIAYSSGTMSFTIFKLNGATNTSQILGKLYSCKIYDNDILVRYFIPCYRKADNVVGMYDLVNNVFYENAGTGTFIKGSNIPTPETPIEVESVGERTKNLLNPNTVEDVNNYIYFFNGLPVAPSETGGNWRVSDYIPIMAGKTYHFNAINNNASAAGIAWYDATKKHISGENTATINANNGVITAPSGASYVRLSWRIDEGYNPDWQNTVQLEEGNSETNFEPHWEGYKIPIIVSNDTEEITINIYLDEPLRKVGNYYDYIDFKNSKVVRNTQYYKITGRESWARMSDKYPNTFYMTNVIDTIYKYNIKILSNQYLGQKSGAGGEWGNGSTWVQSVEDYRRLYICDENYNVAGDFKLALRDKYDANSPVIIYYPLAKPIEENITLPQINIPQGNVTISIDSNGLTIPIEVSYYKK